MFSTTKLINRFIEICTGEFVKYNWTAAAVAVSGYMSAQASKKASKQQAAGQAAARLTAQEAGIKAQDQAEGSYDQTRQDFDPYLGIGRTGAEMYQQEAQGGFGLPEFEAPDPEGIYQDPSYQWRLDQGMEATTRALTKSGQAWGGQRGIALMDYAQKSASQEYSNIYQRSLQDYKTRYATQTQYLDRLQGISQMGQQMTSQLGAIGQAYSANIGQNITGTAGRVMNTQTGEASARAAGTIGEARGYGKMIEAIGGGMSAAGGGTGANYSGISNVYRGSEQDMMLAQQNEGLY